MNAIIFDTHKFIKKLQTKGVSEEQAEIFVETMVGIQQAASDKAIIKPELEQFKSELKYDISLLEQRLRSEINLLKYGIGYLIAAITGLGIEAIFFA